ncbi:unnamed protein product [Tetraodon nigroviridis]|uniref:(spotted green pufferfish) hypothetical protein n=1 Tax=Tetraodon nigroviridis TaxID=99883 RepID=Q4RSD9_TETNG|nr:unnamed protein product [Tetraodon nigroviridis]
MTRTYATLLGLLALFTALFCSPGDTHSAAVSQSAGRQRDPAGEKPLSSHVSEPFSSVRRPSLRRTSGDDLHEGVRRFELLPKAQQKRPPQIPGRD